MFEIQGVTDVSLFFCKICLHKKLLFCPIPSSFFISMTYYNWKLLRILYSLLVSRQFLNIHIMFNISYQKKKLFLSWAFIFNSLESQSRKVIYCNIGIISSVCISQCYGYISFFIVHLCLLCSLVVLPSIYCKHQYIEHHKYVSSSQQSFIIV